MSYVICSLTSCLNRMILHLISQIQSQNNGGKVFEDIELLLHHIDEDKASLDPDGECIGQSE